jgi:hypothetical protein
MMEDLKRFMVVHDDPQIKWEHVERNWRKLAQLKEARWERTYFNRSEGIRYCVWFAPSKRALEKTFKDLEIAFESIIEVEETVPDLWGTRWQEHLEEEEQADTMAF